MTTTSAPSSPTLKDVWRSGRGVLLITALILVGAALPVLVLGPTPNDYLDPQDTSLDGSAALAALLREREVDVTRVESAREAVAATEPGTRVLVSRPDTLTTTQARRLADTDAHLLVVGTAHAEVFLPGAGIRPGAPPASLRPECRLRAADRAGSAYLGGATIDPGLGALGCYPVDGRPTLVSGDGLTLVTDGAFMTNRRLDEDGNAALAMNLAGAGPRLVWVVATEGSARAPAADGEQSLGELVPPQVPWAAAALVLAVLLTAVWRGRRLGPVVSETLPVVVRAAETVEGRSRLYRAHRAREQAAGALRSATTARIVTRLGAPGTATPAQVVTAAAARTGQDVGEVQRLLHGAAPDDDRALVQLAEDLDVLERRVKQR